MTGEPMRLCGVCGVRSDWHDSKYCVPAPVTYCGVCGETYVAGAVARLCDTHRSERDSRLAAWRAAGGTGAHYLEHDDNDQLEGE